MGEYTPNFLQNPASILLAISLSLCLAPASLSAQYATRNAAQTRALNTLAHPLAAQPSGVEATTLPLNLPAGLAYDAAGDLFIASQNDHVIRKVDLLGFITTVAGTGEQGFAGDGGPATAAILDSPTAVALDTANNLYLADTHNHRIRMVAAATGIISTVAGNGAPGFSGDNGPATAAALNLPQAIAVDAAGSLFIADTHNHRIRMVAAATGIISTVAGNGDQGYEGDGLQAIVTGLDTPTGLAVDASSNLYLADTNSQRVRMVAAATGIITTVAGNGTPTFSGDAASAISAGLDRPRGLAVDPTGTLYIADSDNNRIRSVANGAIHTLAGTGEQGFSGDAAGSQAAILDTPRQAAVFTSPTTTSITLSDANNQRTRTIDLSTGSIATVAGMGTPSAESLLLKGPTAIVYGTGSLAVSVTFANNGQTAAGPVTLLEGSQSLATTVLSNNSATLALPLLSAGTHTLMATYAGDALNPAITSGVFIILVTPVPVSVTANSISLLYGQPIPTLTGTLTGVLPPDAARVGPIFSTTATATSPPGAYPITAALTGPAARNYALSNSATSAFVTIGLTQTTILLTSPTLTTFPGTPVDITATVSTAQSGPPAGTVTFFDSGVKIGYSTLTTAGIAILNTSILTLGVHTLTATFGATPDFSASTSLPLTETVSLVPDFTLSPATESIQTASPGSSVTYNFNVSSIGAPFSNPITWTATGLPPGATATFLPASSIPGAAGTPLVLTITLAPTMLSALPQTTFIVTAAAALFLPFLRRRLPRRLTTCILILTAACAFCFLNGCAGARPAVSQTYLISVTGSSTNALSAPVKHTTAVTLIVQ